MTQLTHLVYISRSTFASSENFKGGLEPTAGKILMNARGNNRKNDLTGVLCFGDGYFFQCLEGEETSINNLLLKLKDDPRHYDLTVLSRKPIKTRSFASWEMKFVRVEGPMMKWLQSLGYKGFVPYEFDGEMVEKVLEFLGAADVAYCE